MNNAEAFPKLIGRWAFHKLNQGDAHIFVEFEGMTIYNLREGNELEN